MRVVVNNQKNGGGKPSRTSESRDVVVIDGNDPETGQQRNHEDNNLNNRPMFSVQSSGQRLLIHIVAGLISVAFAAYFVYVLRSESAGNLMGSSETDEILWLVFLILNVALCVFFLIYVMVCFSVTIVSFLAMIVNIWAIVYIIFVWIGKEGAIEFDTVAASISMASSIFHSLMVRYCIVKKVRNQEVMGE